MRKDFKTYDCMQEGKYNVGIGKVISPVDVFIGQFSLTTVIKEHKKLMYERNCPIILMIHSYYKKPLFPDLQLVKYLTIFSDRNVMSGKESRINELKRNLLSDD